MKEGWKRSSIVVRIYRVCTGDLHYSNDPSVPHLYYYKHYPVSLHSMQACDIYLRSTLGMWGHSSVT